MPWERKAWPDKGKHDWTMRIRQVAAAAAAAAAGEEHEEGRE